MAGNNLDHGNTNSKDIFCYLVQGFIVLSLLPMGYEILAVHTSSVI